MDGVFITIAIITFFWATGVGLGYMLGRSAGRLEGRNSALQETDRIVRSWRDRNAS